MLLTWVNRILLCNDLQWVPPSLQVLFHIVAQSKSNVYNINALLMASNVVICGPKWAPVAFGGYL